MIDLFPNSNYSILLQTNSIYINIYIKYIIILFNLNFFILFVTL